MRTPLLRIGVLIALLLLAVVMNLPAGLGNGAPIGFLFGDDVCKAKLCISYLYIGQGDATLIESPTGTQILIDGGPDGSVLRELGRELGFFDRDIDMVIATHPDLDHIGGLVDVLGRYTVGMILLSENESDTPAAAMFKDRVDEEQADVITARRGQVYDIGGGAALEVLFPDRDVSELESNTASIVARLTYGDTEFLFMGDAPESIEEYLVELDGSGLKSDVLKAGHHGSDTSTGEVFLKTIDPEYAIISSGKDNRYGHPHREVTELLEAESVLYKNTAEEGSITIISDGSNIEFK